MPTDNLATLVGKVQQRVGPSIDYYLIVDWLVNGARDIYRSRDWTFRRKQADFLFNAAYTTGTATTERGSSIVNFGGSAAITDAHVGRQLRVGGTDMPIVTIKRRISAQRVEIDRGWPEEAQAAVTFEIYNSLLTVPDDFSSFLSIVDLRRGRQLNWWAFTADDLDRVDPQRNQSGDQAVAVVLRDYAAQSAGVVGSLIQVRGSGNKPSSGGSYDGVADAVFTIEMTSATEFKWKKDGGSYTTGVAIDSDGTQQVLQDNASVAFPISVVYTSGDVFIIPCSAAHNSGEARYEAWPHIKADEARPYLYLAQPLDLNDPGAVLHRYIPSDLVVEKALAQAASFKSEQNGYYDLRLAALHEQRYMVKLEDVVREDEARESSMLTYDSWVNMPTFDSSYLVNHDIGYEIDI